VPAWTLVKDGNPHYSNYWYENEAAPKLFVGPGAKMVLLSSCGKAMFAWRKFVSRNGQVGVNCAIFHNESNNIASELIKEAVELAWNRWPGERLYTYVAPKEIKKSRTPGRCFIKAGWKYVRDAKGTKVVTKVHKHLILELLPVLGTK
jgi:hypothetical protein